MQRQLEEITYKLRIPQRKPWDAMANNISTATSLVVQRDKVSIPFDPTPSNASVPWKAALMGL